MGIDREAHAVAARVRRRVEHRELELVAPAAAAQRRLPGDALEAAPRSLERELARGVEARAHLLVHLVARAAADRVVRVIGEQLAPRSAQPGALVRRAEQRADRGPRLRPRAQLALGRAVRELDPGARRPHAEEQRRRLRSDQLAAVHGSLRGRRLDRGDEVLEQRALYGEARRHRDALREVRGARVGRRVVDAVQEQDRLLSRERGELERALADRSGGLVGIRAHVARGVEITLAQLAREHCAAVGRLPVELGRQDRLLVAVAAPEHERAQPEAREDLRQLCGMAE
jgi:hypothetical protein